jgi:hypothetical protein
MISVSLLFKRGRRTSFSIFITKQKITPVLTHSRINNCTHLRSCSSNRLNLSPLESRQCIAFLSNQVLVKSSFIDVNNFTKIHINKRSSVLFLIVIFSYIARNLYSLHIYFIYWYLVDRRFISV